MRKVKYKENHVIERCPKCNNNTSFKIHSQQVAEDGCEIWAQCGECDYDPTENNTDHRIESVMGGCDDDNCQDAVLYAWNEPIKELTENL